jgi:hypothetical protein
MNLEVPSREELRLLVERNLKKQGFIISEGSLIAPRNHGKDDIRKRHSLAVRHKIDQGEKSLRRYETKLLDYIANGNEIRPDGIRPRIVEVMPDSEEELLFRYASLHWSIPLSSGYGRRLRFVVMDESNGNLIGVIGLGDPVFGLRARDEWTGWNHEQRRERLRYVMDAFVLGAVPPYSMLLCGKLIALLATSNEVRRAFKRKYGKRQSVIAEREHDGRLAMITTTSALGRSSIYNRLRFHKDYVYQSVGVTSAWGEIYFSNGLYGPLTAYAEANLQPTAKQSAWGNGFRNRREVVRKCLQDIGLPESVLQHRIEREVFVVPLAKNTQAFLRGDNQRLLSFDRSSDSLFAWFRERWLLPRSVRDDRFRQWEREKWRLWE